MITILFYIYISKYKYLFLLHIYYIKLYRLF